MDKDVHRRSFTEVLGVLSNLLLSNSLNSLSSASMTTTTRSPLSSPSSLLPPVPQNLSPSLAVFGISPVTQSKSLPQDPASLQSPGFLFVALRYLC